MKVGLYFGSFNPVHIGHMIIANSIVDHTDLDQVWLVVSPHNPLKKKSSLANDFDRLHLVNLAIGENVRLRASNIEFGLPRPSYTIDTLAYLREKYPNNEFVLIMGEDNLGSLPKWKNYEALIEGYQIYVYRRSTQEVIKPISHNNIRMLEDLPLLHISSTFIRRAISENRSVQYLVPDAVFQYLEESTLYRNLT